VFRDPKETLVSKVLLALREIQESRVPRAIRVLPVSQARKDLRAIQAQLD